MNSKNTFIALNLSLIFYMPVLWRGAEVKCQNIGINSTGAAPDNSAMLDVESTTAGFLIPCLTSAERAIIPAPAQGLIIYNTTTNYFNVYNTTPTPGWFELSSISYVDNTTGAVAPSIGTAFTATGATAAPSAMCEINSTTKGLLIPRTTTGSIASPATGLCIYNTTTNALSYYDGSSWQSPCPNFVENVTGGGSLSGTPGVAINETGVAPDDCAMLDISSASKGLLIPRMTDAERNSLNPATGLLIYNTTTNLLNYWNGTGWYSFVFSAPVEGTHIPSSDHIVWNWNAVLGAKGYKYNTVNDYGTATDNGTSISYTQTGLTENTAYTLYVWAYNSCENSAVTTLNETSCSFISATGGTITTDGDYKVHAFLTSGTFEITVGCGDVEYLIVAGGGGGGWSSVGGAGGGGAGGMLFASGYNLATGPYTVIVGAGGAGSTKGGNSSFNGITAIGGGRGGPRAIVAQGVLDGGSGGGTGNTAGATIGYGVVGQGRNGGSGAAGGKGGGGAGGVGTNNGGVGLANSITGSSVFYAGGGGRQTGGLGGNGGGGNSGANGTNGLGGGGGGNSGLGGSGVVIVRYKFQ